MTLNQAHKRIDSNRVARELKKTVEKDIALNTADAVSALWIISLHDEFGFGKKRLDKVLERVNNQYEAIYLNGQNNEEGCSIDDIYAVLREMGFERVIK